MEQDGADPVEVAGEFLAGSAGSPCRSARSRATAIATQVPAIAKDATATAIRATPRFIPSMRDQQLGDAGQGDGQRGHGQRRAPASRTAPPTLAACEVLLHLDRGQAGLELGEGEEVLAELGDVGDHVAGAGAVAARPAPPVAGGRGAHAGRTRRRDR